MDGASQRQQVIPDNVPESGPGENDGKVNEKLAGKFVLEKTANIFYTRYVEDRFYCIFLPNCKINSTSKVNRL